MGGKRAVSRAVRQFLLYGVSFYKGEQIGSQDRLVELFSAEVVGAVRAQMEGAKADREARRRHQWGSARPPRLLGGDIKVVSWNVQSLVQAGRYKEILTFYRRHRADVVMLQGTRWGGEREGRI